VTRLGEQAYLIVTGAETETKDFNWLQRAHRAGRALHCDERDFGHGVLSVMGPRSREFLQSLTPG